MVLEELKKKAQQNMHLAVERLKDKIKKIRTGRAHISLLDGITVSYYGNQSELSHVASLSCPDARTLLISPWDQNALKNIEEAIVKSSIGMAPQNDGKVIRLKVPELTEERRKEVIKNFKKDVEKAKIELRKSRQEVNSAVRQLLKEKKISEDECKSAENDIQHHIDHFNKQVDEMSLQKEKELTQV